MAPSGGRTECELTSMKDEGEYHKKPVPEPQSMHERAVWHDTIPSSSVRGVLERQATRRGRERPDKSCLLHKPPISVCGTSVSMKRQRIYRLTFFVQVMYKQGDLRDETERSCHRRVVQRNARQ
jgi:hypothetical protein